MTQVILGEHDGVEWAIKQFRRKVQRAGILKEFRNKRYYLKPSDARRKKESAARRQRAKRLRERPERWS